MLFWCVLIVLCSVLPNISSLTEDDSGEFMECPGGYCLSKHMCPEGKYKEFNPQDEAKISLRIGEEEVDDCLDFLKICCKNETEILTNPKCPGGYCVSKDLCPNGGYEESNAQTSGLVAPRGSMKVCPNKTQICCTAATRLQSIRVIENEEAGPLDTCGVSNPNGLHYEVSGNRTYAQYAEFPWMVLILKTSDTSTGLGFVGAGSLIHPRFVLSAAHTLLRVREESNIRLIARFGEWDTKSSGEVYPKQDININPNVIMHPQYDARSLGNDIALAVLEQDVVYQRHIRPICLPNPGDGFDGQRCISTGWGKEGPTEKYAQILKRVDLPVVPRKNCVQMLRVTRLGGFFELHGSVMCAGGEAGVDMCDGDGGSPLACKTQDGTYVVAGIVSWGLACLQENVPGVYVDVAQFVAWIQSTLASM